MAAWPGSLSPREPAPEPTLRLRGNPRPVAKRGYLITKAGGGCQEQILLFNNHSISNSSKTFTLARASIRGEPHFAQAGYDGRMLVVITQDYAELSRAAARIVANAIRRTPDLRLGLATGETQIGLYEELVRMRREQGLDFARVVTFNLDEYIGLPAGHPQSFRAFMFKALFDHVNVARNNIHIPDGTVRGNFDEYCRAYEHEIQQAGGIDLQVLGIGKDGHIGFNEPTSSLVSRTRPKTLTRQTIEANRGNFAANEEPPQAAITMGVGTILQARRILLLASGAGKARAVARAVEGPVTASATASSLQMHGDTTLIVDRDSAAHLEHKDYYERALEMTRKLTPERLE
jgi:glucosamine-6-phosphate deaminase